MNITALFALISGIITIIGGAVAGIYKLIKKYLEDKDKKEELK